MIIGWDKIGSKDYIYASTPKDEDAKMVTEERFPHAILISNCLYPVHRDVPPEMRKAWWKRFLHIGD